MIYLALSTASIDTADPPATSFKPPRPWLVGVVYLLAWYALDAVAQNFESAPEIQVWYPPVGLTVVLLLVFGLRYWPLLLVNSLMHNFLVGPEQLDIRTFILFTLTNIVGYTAACALLQRRLRIDPRLFTLRDVGWFMGIAALGAPFLIAVIQSLNFAWAGLYPWREWGLRALHYWAGDATGVAMLAPLLLLLLRHVPSLWQQPAPATVHKSGTSFTFTNIGVLLLHLLVLGATIFFAYGAPRAADLDYTYLIFMPMIWLAVRYGLSGAVAAVLIINVGAAVLAGHSIDHDNGLALQFGLLTVSGTGVLLGAFMTDRKQRAAALRESEQQYKTITRATNDAVWNWDLHTDLVWRNNSFRRLFGYVDLPTRAPIQFWYDHIHPDDRAEVMDGIQRVIESGTFWAAEYRFEHANGAYFVVFDRAYVVCNDDGRPVRLIGGMMDITARKQAEAQLHTSQQRLRTVLEHTPIILFSVDQQHRFTLEAGGGLHALGIEPNAVTGRSIYDIEFDNPQIVVLVEQALAGASAHAAVDLRGRSFDTHYLPLRDQQGAVTGMIGVATDITDLKQANEQQLLLERRLLEAQKFESLAELTGGVAHDFNNLLTAVMGNIELAQLDIDQDAPAQPALELSMIAARHAVDLVRQLLAYSGRGTVTAQPLDLNTLIEGMLQLLVAATPKTATIQHQLTPDLPLINADATQLRQVIMNLVINGTQALSGAPGSVAVTTRVFAADAAYITTLHIGTELAPNTYVALDVTDTGSGIDVATLGRIFDPYFTTKPTGRGLGLAAVLGIVRAHGGGLRVQSDVGRGTTFTVLLPPIG